MCDCKKCKHEKDLKCEIKMNVDCRILCKGCNSFSEISSKPILIGFAGKARHGKTTSALAVKKIFEEKGLKVIISPCAKALKDIAIKIGWDGAKDEKGRTLLQQLSNPIKGYFGDDYYAKKSIEYGLKEKADIILVDDVRMFPEVNYFNSLADNKLSKCCIFRIERPNFVSDLSEKQLLDKSEVELDNYFKEADIIINDGSINNLTKKIVKKLKKSELL